jgi:hypothetical protein
MQHFKLFIESFSLGSGAFLIGVVSLAVVWVLCSVLPIRLGVFCGR